MINFSGLSQDALWGRLLRVPLRMIPGRTVVRVLQGQLRGARWIVDSGPHGYWLGSYESLKQRELGRHVRPGSVAFDIGAQAGFYSLLLSRLVGPEGLVVAFEPVPGNYARTLEHVLLNRCRNVTAVQAAVADFNGTSRFDLGPSSSMGRMSPGGATTVTVVSLDQWVADNRTPMPEVLKIDVEGAEASVLDGAEDILRKARPALFIALHGPDARRDCLARLARRGYRVEPLGAESLDETDEIFAH